MPLTITSSRRDTSLHHKQSVEFLHNGDITRQFHVAPLHSTNTLLNQIFKSSYLSVDKACCSGWAFEPVVSRARLRRISRNCNSSFTMKSLHCHSAVAEKRSIVKHVLHAVRTAMIQNDVDFMAGDCNGASWRRKTGSREAIRQHS